MSLLMEAGELLRTLGEGLQVANLLTPEGIMSSRFSRDTAQVPLKAHKRGVTATAIPGKERGFAE